MVFIIDKLQAILNYEGCSNFQFVGDGLGKIGTSGFLLGLVGGMHIAFILLSVLILYSVDPLPASTVTLLHTLIHWSLYMSCLCTFHFLEFFSTAVSQPSLLAYESYVINHSTAYTTAALASWIEFWLEYYLLGGVKLQWRAVGAGLVLIVSGQVIRSLAMWTCGPHFSHIIMEEKTREHHLVTNGIYSVFRHPAYFGWFYWSIGTQVLLCNPLCFVAYFLASWSFFNRRIPFEERLLLGFYPATYPDYCKRTVIGIPFISGVVIRQKAE